MVELASDFEDDLREAILDEVEQTVRDEIGPQLKQAARENFEAYANRHDYDIEHIWQDAEGPIVSRDGDSVQLRVEWPELTALFEFGVSEHTIEGNPLLHFYWEAKDTWVTTESVEWGSETGGIPESRAVRDALNEVRRVVSA
ncbi:hypothetical protein [Halosimplex halophilum]|uniref:hypothetical protein n=1 Tax=Halosimplex halophilum TaxID=2559572 RepID=UPI00107F3E95|nr:hypothetical protein [Halosimplex halophilum]